MKHKVMVAQERFKSFGKNYVHTSLCLLNIFSSLQDLLWGVAEGKIKHESIISLSELENQDCEYTYDQFMKHPVQIVWKEKGGTRKKHEEVESLPDIIIPLRNQKKQIVGFIRKVIMNESQIDASSISLQIDWLDEPFSIGIGYEITESADVVDSIYIEKAEFMSFQVIEKSEHSS